MSCSRLPSSASPRNKPSKASNEDNSADTHKTPVPTSLKTPAFGDNASGSYGGDNRAAIHVDGVMADATIEADGVVVMRTGVLV